jgi:hypothetical protein
LLSFRSTIGHAKENVIANVPSVIRRLRNVGVIDDIKKVLVHMWLLVQEILF